MTNRMILKISLTQFKALLEGKIKMVEVYNHDKIRIPVEHMKIVNISYDATREMLNVILEHKKFYQSVDELPWLIGEIWEKRKK